MDTANILFIMTDQQRADHVGWHPHARIRLPNLDRLAEGCVFRNCVSANPICVPARTALLTGRYTHQIGTLAMSGDLPRHIPTYAQALKKAGYHTAGIGKFHWLQTWKWGCPKGNGIDLANLHDELKGYGFDEVWEATGKQLIVQNRCDWAVQLEAKGILEDARRFLRDSGPNFGAMEARHADYTGEPWPFAEEDYVDIATANRAIASLRARPREKPYFGFVSFCGPHPPFDPPQRFLDLVPEQDERFVESAPEDAPMDEATRERMRRLRRAYKAMLLCIDEQIGRLFAALEAEGIWENTVIVFTSDHGEMLGDHGFFGKQRPLWQAATVPAAVRHPRYLTARVCDRVVEMTDLTATILDAAGLDAQNALKKDWPAFLDVIPCRSLMPIVRGETDAVREYAFCECNGWWHMIQDDEFKYIRYPAQKPDAQTREQLYHLGNDPDCRHDLAGDPRQRDRLAVMRERLLHVLSTTPAAQSRWAPLMGPDGSSEHPLGDSSTSKGHGS